MAAVQVTVHNNSDQKVSLTIDDEADADRIEYFQELKRRDDIKDVTVVSPNKPGGGGVHKKAIVGDAGDAS